MNSHRATRSDRRAAKLPTWDEMSDLDKGIALRYLHRTSPPLKGHRGAHWNYRHWRKTMVCRFHDDPRLVDLDPKAAARFARKATGGHRKIVASLTPLAYGKLFMLATRKFG